MTTVSEVEEVCKKIVLYEPTDCSVEVDGDRVLVVLRDSAGDDEPSEVARQSAIRIKNSVKNAFGGEVNCEVQFVDEWIDIEFTIKTGTK